MRTRKRDRIAARCDKLAALVRHWLGIPAVSDLAAQVLDLRVRYAELSAIECLRGRELDLLMNGKEHGAKEAEMLAAIRKMLREAVISYGTRRGGIS